MLGSKIYVQRLPKALAGCILQLMEKKDEGEFLEEKYMHVLKAKILGVDDVVY